MAEKKSGKSKEKIKRLKIKKETIRDLGTADGKARAIKGGVVHTNLQQRLMYCSAGGGC